MADLRGNAVFAQAGGPTAAINSSLAGAIQEAMAQTCFDDLYGASDGILGVLQEELFDLRKERADDIEDLKRTPSAAMGSCAPRNGDADLERILEVFRAHNVRYFFYVGGSEAMLAAGGIARLAAGTGHEMRVMGIPGTAENDLAHTDHVPGYGSAVKCCATAVMEAGRDTEALWSCEPCTVMEVPGRSAGWLAAGAGLARREEGDAPHLIYLPERPVSLARVAEDVRGCIARHHRCFIAAAEGMKNESGEYLAPAPGGAGAGETEGAQAGGVAGVLGGFIEKEVGVAVRTCRPGTAQRNAMHFASLVDIDEAVECGRAAVRKAAMGQSGFMMTLVREGGPVYRCSVGSVALSEVIGSEKPVDDEFINEQGNGITEAMKHYVRPLVRGEAPISVGPDGLPIYVRLARRFVPKKCAQWEP